MTDDEKRRYSRQTGVREIGHSGQEKLLGSTVGIVGCGALGSMVAMQLAAAGVGHIVIADFDNIEISNLQRQFFFKTEEAGLPKAGVLKIRMQELNPRCKVDVCGRLVDANLAMDIFQRCDFIVDATDNPASKKMIGEIGEKLGVACCMAGVSGFHGQIMTVLPGGTSFDELFSSDDNQGILPCSADGVIGPAAAFCASVQASEAIKYITRSGTLLSSGVFTFDLLEDSFRVFQI